ncbi:MAG: hypothetical protein APR63_14085 [Desulfuromonas sp. SDB]|nr:MAG: hypothetical protein APR63_14085 [Desulfuromonas sp. SDB]
MEQSISNIYKEEKPRLFNYIKSKISDFQEAEDILSEVFIQAIVNFNTLESIDNLLGWLYTVAKNKIVDSYRKKNRKIHFSEIDNQENLYQLLSIPGKDIIGKLRQQELIEIIIEEIEKLPPEQMEVLIEHELNGKSFREISRKTEVPLNTLISRKQYALKTLRQKLKKLSWRNYV